MARLGSIARRAGIAICLAVMVLAVISAYGWLGWQAWSVLLPLMVVACPAACLLANPRRTTKRKDLTFPRWEGQR